MAEHSSFFDSVNADRVYYAADWASHLSKYFTNGIFNNELKVVPNNNMTVSVQTGNANINGYRYFNDAEKVLSVANADGVLNRIDNIVIRLDIPNRQITTEIVKGVFAENPVAPALVRGTSIYDIRIAKINVPAGTTAITDELIEDTRFNGNDCGNVICAVQTPDFSNIFSQYVGLWNAFFTAKRDEFERWFNLMKGQLSEDAAGNLQLEILDLLSNFSFDEYDPLATYIENDFCIRNNFLYKCIQSINTPEEFDPLKWSRVSIADELSNALVLKDFSSLNFNDTSLKTGIYLASDESIGLPFNSAWIIKNINIMDIDFILQIAYRYRNDTMDGTIFIRQYNTLGTTGWKDWKKVLTNDDTGWITATVTSAFKGYGNNNNNLPKYRKVNNYVEIRGIVSPTSDIAADGTANIFTLPEGYRPDYDRAFICQGSGINRWLLTVQSNGVVMFSRYGASASAKAPTGAWLPISVGFLVG